MDIDAPLEVIPAFLKQHGLPDNPDIREQLHVMMTSLHIYNDRELRYRGGWRARGWKGNVADILRKAERIKFMFWHQNYEPLERDNADDVYDLINYCVFMLRNAGERNRTGEAQKMTPLSLTRVDFAASPETVWPGEC